MLQLVYISTSRSAAIGEELLRSVLTASRRNNAAAGITGLLLVGGRRFLQALEGPADEVELAYDRIKRDDRHFAFVELGRREIAAPEFGPWSMACTGAGNAPAGAGLGDAVHRLVDTIPDPDVRAQFAGFAELHSRAA